RDNDEWTLGLLTNAELIHMHQTSSNATLLRRAGDEIIWTAQGEDGSRYIAFFNIGEKPILSTVDLNYYGWQKDHFTEALDIWTGKTNDIHDILASGSIAPHGAVL